MERKNQYGLLGAEKDQIISILSNNKKINKIILFGSRAKGNFKNGSDIDLSLVDTHINLNDILNASIQIDNLHLPYKVDLIIYDRIKEPGLKGHIDRVGIILYDKNYPETLSY